MKISRTALLSALTSATLLSACGGGGTDSEAPPPPDLQPTFQLAQVLPPEPDDIDADGSHASAAREPSRAALSAGAETPVGALQQDADSLRSGILSATGNGESVTPSATTVVATYYTPAQIAAAYGLDKLPAGGIANKGAYQGSGQTIAIVGAFHNNNIAADLAAFSVKFGLPSCAVQTIAATAALPLAAPTAGSGCSFSVVYATAAGAMTAKAPAVDAGWKTETSLDVEWSHATAPWARIILVEAASAGGSDLLGAITLAARLGAKVVSMSFGGAEFSGQKSYDSVFSAAGVTYLAASGDSGHGVSWPAVSQQVLGVGGSTLAFSAGLRSETAWSGSGGGLSLYNDVPTWQTGVKVVNSAGKVVAPTTRALPDVAFNANPNSGQLVYVTPATGSNGWLVAGGTSVGTPQWAGLVAVANAVRGAAGKAPLGNPGTALFRTLGANTSLYASTLLDITAGSNGSCNGCASTAGYDLVSGLGTPNVQSLIAQLAAL